MGDPGGRRQSGPRCIALVGPFQSGKTTLLEAILERSRDEMRGREHKHFELVADRLSRGSLSELICRRMKRARGKRDALQGVYEELMAALELNRPWRG